jgi:galactokinase
VNDARVFRAPGRVNLIGEHTDYNLGFVLPIALDLDTRIRTIPSPDGLLHVHSAAHDEGRSWPVAAIASLAPQSHWSDYVIGVAKQLLLRGFAIPPLSLHVESTVPEGAGLSSSAALEVASALALLQGRELARLEIARLCQRAESDFVGMPCGIMDQYVAVFGHEHAATKIDCRSLESEAVPLPDGVAILAVNSMVKHSLGQSAYRTRVAECAEASKAVGVASLREATLVQVLAASMPETVRRRARHIVTENQRVESFVEAAGTGDVPRMGRLFLESHRSMRDDYEISCAEIDFLVDAAAALPGCLGARMTGGGFGGCTVNLVEPLAAPAFTASIRRLYRERYGIDPRVIPCIPAPGAPEEKIRETPAAEPTP